MSPSEYTEYIKLLQSLRTVGCVSSSYNLSLSYYTSKLTEIEKFGNSDEVPVVTRYFREFQGARWAAKWLCVVQWQGEAADAHTKSWRRLAASDDDTLL